jgi:hypothetical protein
VDEIKDVPNPKRLLFPVLLFLSIDDSIKEIVTLYKLISLIKSIIATLPLSNSLHFSIQYFEK